MSISESFVIKTMTRAEVDWAVELAADQGWNPGLYDAECFYRTDPEGFLIGLLDGKPVACISAVSYGRRFGFIGFYIVLPEHRGKGYGYRIWQAAMERMRGHNTALDGVPDQVTNYMKSGFHLAYNSYRFEKRFTGLAESRSPGIVPLAEVSLEDVLRYDRQCFPEDRRVFLECWLKMPESTALGCVEAGRLKGYGVIRRCRKGYKIGPLFSDDAGTAEKLYLALASGAEDDAPVFLDIPEPNREAVALAGKYGMKTVFATARMYTGKEPDIRLDKVFGVTTFELG